MWLKLLKILTIGLDMGNINFMSGRRSKGALPPHLEEKKGNYYYVVKTWKANMVFS